MSELDQLHQSCVKVGTDCQVNFDLEEVTKSITGLAVEARKLPTTRVCGFVQYMGVMVVLVVSAVHGCNGSTSSQCCMYIVLSLY